jgi:hypothetical protein
MPKAFRFRVEMFDLGQGCVEYGRVQNFDGTTRLPTRSTINYASTNELPEPVVNQLLNS